MQWVQEIMADMGKMDWNDLLRLKCTDQNDGDITQLILPRKLPTRSKYQPILSRITVRSAVTRQNSIASC